MCYGIVLDCWAVGGLIWLFRLDNLLDGLVVGLDYRGCMGLGMLRLPKL